MNDGYDDLFHIYYGKMNTGIENNVTTVWKFVSNDDSLVLMREKTSVPLMIYGIPCYTFVTSTQENYSILKLTSKNLKLKITNTNQSSIVIVEFKN